MTGDDTARLIYLGIIAGAVMVWFVTNHRQSFSKTVQQALAWGLIILGAIAAVGLWDDIRGAAVPYQTSVTPAGRIEIPHGIDGHYRVIATVNGQPVQFLVDTGASDLVLSMSDARRIGLDTNALPFVGRAMTANGEVRTAPVTLESVTLGNVTSTRVRASVNEGDLATSLLGMSFLRRFQEISISGGKLILTP